MSHLLDVNLLLACAWQSHAEHAKGTTRNAKASAQFSRIGTADCRLEC
jgi:hypothetical protein